MNVWEKIFGVKKCVFIIAPVNICNSHLLEQKQEVLGCDVDMYFLFCNAHFLWTFLECEKLLKSLVNELGHGHGRDKRLRHTKIQG